MIAVPWQTTWVLPDDMTTEEGARDPDRVRDGPRVPVHVRWPAER